MKGVFKRAAAVLVTAVVAGGGAALSGCTVSLGVDGRDGQDVSAYDLWQLAKEQSGNPDLTYHEFLKEYLNYTGEEVEQMASLQAAINRSLLSSVQVTAEFTETNSSTEDFWPWPWGGGQEESESYISQGSGVIIDLDKEAGDPHRYAGLGQIQHLRAAAARSLGIGVTALQGMRGIKDDGSVARDLFHDAET